MVSPRGCRLEHLAADRRWSHLTVVGLLPWITCGHERDDIHRKLFPRRLGDDEMADVRGIERPSEQCAPQDSVLRDELGEHRRQQPQRSAGTTPGMHDRIDVPIQQSNADVYRRSPAVES
jgi:hypothetical protein